MLAGSLIAIIGGIVSGPPWMRKWLITLLVVVLGVAAVLALMVT